jgi:hypothetical protein
MFRSATSLVMRAPTSLKIPELTEAIPAFSIYGAMAQNSEYRS